MSDNFASDKLLFIFLYGNIFVMATEYSKHLTNYPLISIIMPVYNADKYLEDSIQSCLSQTLTNFELICIDDCSSDNSLNTLFKYAALDPRIIVLQMHENQGSAASRNYGINMSRGQYICFLDADDMYKPIFLEKQLRFCQAHGPFVFSSYDRLAKKTYTTWHVRKKQNALGCLKGDDISCLTAFFDSDKLGKPLFDVSLHMNEDSMYWIELLKKCEYAYGNPESLAIYRIVEKSKSKNKIKSAQYMWYIYRKKCNIIFLKSLYYLLSMIIYSIRKYSNVK